MGPVLFALLVVLRPATAVAGEALPMRATPGQHVTSASPASETIARVVNASLHQRRDGDPSRPGVEPLGHVRGIVRTARREGDAALLRVAASTGVIWVLAPWPRGHEQELVDADIQVRGVWGRLAFGRENALHRVLRVDDATVVQVLERAPADPFDVPAVPLADALRLGVEAPPPHRIKVIGTIAGQVGRSLYINDDGRYLRARVAQDGRVAPGDVVEVLGFVADQGASATLVDAVFRQIGRRSPPDPIRVDAARLVAGSHDNALVRLEGTLLRHDADRDDYELVLQEDSVTFEASLPVSGAGAPFDALAAGSRVEITGIADVRRAGLGQPASFDIQLRSAGDVRVLKTPSWWTPQRSLYVFATLLIAFISVSGWVVALRRRLPTVERARLESEDRYRRLFEQAPAGHFLSHPDGTLIACNEAFARLLGFPTIAEALRVPCDSLYASTEDRRQWLARLREDTVVENLEVTLRTRDGHLVTALETAVARVDAHGHIVEIQGFLIDRTEQKRTEAALRERDAQLLHAQKMEAVGRLAGGVAHDFNNLLTAITGYADLAREACADRRDAVAYVDEVRKAARSAAGLTRQLLAFSRKQVCEPTVFDLNVATAELEMMLRRLLGEDIELGLHLCGEPLYVKADRAQLDQVLVNLAVNARDAMPRGGRLNIATQARDSHVALVVSDTGCGIDGQTIPRIFEPFFTTKEPGRGTGLGLAMVYGAITQSGGVIDVQSAPGRGATFTIRLPRVTPELKVARADSASSIQKGTGTILLVEDEAAVRSLAREMLRRAGYRVLVAQDGREALAIAQENATAIDLLLSDVVMPGLSGVEVAHHFAAARPQTRVVLMSGHADHPTLKDRSWPLTAAFLQKPFTQDMLLAAIHGTLRTGPAAVPVTTLA